MLVSFNSCDESGLITNNTSFDLSDNYNLLNFFKNIHEWCYLSHNKLKYLNFDNFIYFARKIWSLCVLYKYHKWVINSTYLFPWQDQQQIHRTGMFSWEKIEGYTNDNDDSTKRKRSKSSPRMRNHI